jgi:ribosomal protein L24
MNKIRKGDEVIVITGRDKGKRGKVSLRKDDSMLVIDGINMVKKHTKPNPPQGCAGRHRAKGHAHSPVQRRDFQCGHRQGGSRGHQTAG